MAHQLTITNNRAEMAYAKTIGTPWHGLGQPVDPKAKPEEWAREAGMLWTIERRELSYTGKGGQILTVPNRVAMVRSDNDFLLGVLSNQFAEIMPIEALEFFASLSDYEIVTCGTLFGGKKYWAMARVRGDDLSISKHDKVGQYLFFMSGCDGSTATTIDHTTVCIVCNNTLTAAMADESAQRITLRHDKKIDVAAIHARLDLATSAFDSFMRKSRELAKRDLTTPEVFTLTRNLMVEDIKTSAKPDEVLDTTTAKKILSLYMGNGMGAEMDTRAGTAWGWLNAVTEFYDHHANRDPSARMASAWTGKGNAVKDAAFSKVLDLIGV